MAEEIPLAELLVRAGEVFTSTGKLARALEKETQSAERGSEETVWLRFASTFRELSESLLELREPMLNPPDGFGPVAQPLSSVAALMKTIRESLASNRGEPDYLACYPDLKLASQDGWEAVKEMALARQIEGVGVPLAGKIFQRLLEDDPNAGVGLDRAMKKLRAFSDAMQSLSSSPEYQVLQEMECQQMKELADAIRAAHEQSVNELTARHFPRPESLEDWEHIARIAEMPGEKILEGKLTLSEVLTCAIAWADRQVIKAKLSGLREPLIEPPLPDEKKTPKKRGRKKANFKTIQKEAEIAAAWARARDAGVYKSDFVKDNNLTIRKLKALLDRVAKRNRPFE